MPTIAATALVALAAVIAAVGCGSDDGSGGDAGVIEGTVTSGDGTPEAGVWVVAETDSLPTKYRKIVVTNDDGKFLLPEMPEADYQVWARGYGLLDTSKVDARTGDSVELSAKVTSPQEAAKIYPSNYFLSMFEPPDTSADWMTDFKLTCMLCHQFGSVATRAGATPEFFEKGLKKSNVMNAGVERLGGEKFIQALADWGKRIKDGEVPKETPPRPQGIERNLVVTQWEFGDNFTYAHDEIATDKRNPTLNGDGPVWAVDLANDRLFGVDPTTHEVEEHKFPTRDGFDTAWCDQTFQTAAALEGSETPIKSGFGSLGCPAPGGTTAFAGKYDNPANPHNPMMDDQGRVWATSQIRREWADDAPEWCKNDPVIRDNSHHRQLSVFDPKTDEFHLIDSCVGSHHLQFAEDGVLYYSGDSYAIGWFDPSKWDPEKPETVERASGYSEVKVDSDGDGKADMPFPGFNYGIVASPDGTVWTASPGAPGHIMRFDPETKTHEVYQPPAPISGPRGVDVDTDGVIWTATGGSGHIASFDRRLCKQTWGDGTQCPEGWKSWEVPGPAAQVESGAKNVRKADLHYYVWVDQHNTFGLGEDVVIANGTDSDSLIAFNPATEEFTRVRIPYPLNTYTRGLDGRIDDPDAGWKGRGLWFSNGGDPIFHSETGVSYMGHVQLRDDPLSD
ncbi:hypothetical protein [Miltoncostaea marina]|uniref:hypothetical protein n=1 Tax=Miltoncostaea marina TaxID=2843215 RepID=UPI001C3D6519|nr:hypothetical protein [Miltoncostaea marina]